ncbi:hypothetical protein ACFSL6_24970 [Paenibacillus thailandensis]|uniref:YqbQ/XkdQ domain-containing protein n=1 Tax=Paenibacillus thailandensis TaxID=393250 RepID=A0ABW5R5E9_9BACL
MAHQLFAIVSGNKYDITGLISNLSWSSNVDTLGEELSFDYAKNDYLTIDNGDFIVLYNDKVLHHYVVVESTEADRNTVSYECYDYAWWLNKSKTVIQFSKVSVSTAIEKLCDKFDIMHNIVPIPTLISKIYKDNTVSDIILDLLEQAAQETGNKYYMEMVDKELTIRKQTDLLINPTIQLADNIAAFSLTDFISNPSHKSSIDELRNNVIVVSNKEDSTSVYAEASDNANINKYGLLTETVTVDEKDESQARQIAKTTLADLNKINHEISLELLGHDDIKAGRLIDINEPITNIVGRFLIKSANHTVSNGIHKVSIELGVR